MGYSKFEFRPNGSFQYIEGYLFRRVKTQARDTLFWIDNITGSKFECTVKTSFWQQLIVR